MEKLVTDLYKYFFHWGGDNCWQPSRLSRVHEQEDAIVVANELCEHGNVVAHFRSKAVCEKGKMRVSKENNNWTYRHDKWWNTYRRLGVQALESTKLLLLCSKMPHVYKCCLMN